MGLGGKVTIRAKIRAHPIGRLWFSNTVDNHIAALTNAERNDVRGIWHDGHEIVRNDSHTVAVDGEALNTFGTAINKP